jgi:L-seryl-tRNA(Ser) seleniumtransferase
VEDRARRLAERLQAVASDSVAIAIEPDAAAVGGGAAPGLELATWVVSVRSEAGPDALAARMRRAPVPVLGRIRDDAVVLDARTIADAEVESVVCALAAALAGSDR